LCFALPGTAQQDDLEETMNISKVLNEQRIAWNKGDIRGYMQGYWHSDSLAFVGRNGLTRGWDSTLARYERSYNSPAAMGVLSFSDLRIDMLSPEAAFMWGAWKVKRTKDVLKGRFTLLFKKISGKWVIVYDHSS
jgi:ketosteroid isomerase-like protein